MFPIAAVPIYGETTRSFLHQWIMLDPEDDDGDPPTAFGVRFLTPKERAAGDCYICDDLGTLRDILVEHGATGSPAGGVPAHLLCQLSGDGFLVHTQNVRFLEPEVPSLNDAEKALLKMAVMGYRGICENLVNRSSARDWATQLRVWDSLAAKLKIN